MTLPSLCLTGLPGTMPAYLRSASLSINESGTACAWSLDVEAGAFVAVCRPSIRRIVLISECTQSSISDISVCNDLRERISEAICETRQVIHATLAAHAREKSVRSSEIDVADTAFPHEQHVYNPVNNLWITFLPPSQSLPPPSYLTANGNLLQI